MLAAGCGPNRGAGSGHLRVDGSGVRWARSIAATDRASAAGIAIAGDGAAIVGSFEGTLDGGGDSMSAGSADGFVTALDAAGAPRWSKRFGGLEFDAATAVAGAPGGRIAVAGTFSSDADLFGRVVHARGARDAFLAVLEADGSLAWLLTLDASTDAALNAVAFDPSGGVVAVGYFSDSVTVAGARYASAGSQDALIVSVDPAGTPRFVRRAGGPAADHAHGIAMTADGARLFVVGGFARQADFGGAVLRSNRHQDGFLAALHPDGRVDWVNTFGGTERDVALGVTALADGGIAIAGRFESADASFGGVEIAADGSGAGFAAVFSAEGEPRWSTRIGSGMAEARAISSEGGRIVIAGTFERSQGIAGSALVPRGKRDCFVAYYAADSGAERGALAIGGREHDDVSGLAVDGGRALVAGTYAGSLQVPQVDPLATGAASAAFAVSLATEDR